MFAAVRPTLLSLLATLSGIPAYWRDQPRPFGANDDGAWLLPHIGPAQRIGHPTRVYVYDPAYDPTAPEYDPLNGTGEEVAETLQEVHNFTLSVLCESLSQADNMTAHEWLGELRTGLESIATRDALNALQLGIVKIHPTVDHTDLIDQRYRSIATLDIRMSISTQKIVARTTYIETIEVTGP